MSRDLWERYREWYFQAPELGFGLDVSRMDLPPNLPASMEAGLARAFDEMAALERGAIANPDENRMVGHYWLRAPELAPGDELGATIRVTVDRLLEFAARVRAGEVRPPTAQRFTRQLVIGIGGSALGPQFVAEALGRDGEGLAPEFLDNTDPDGIDRVLARLGDDLARTLTVVVSKSGGTPETRNGMLETRQAYRALGLDLGPHAVAITGEGSNLHKFAARHGFLERFPMWDWVGGRTSEMSAVGLLPAALQGIDVRAMLDGAAAMDQVTRSPEARRNPAALLALSWYHAGGGRGGRDMVILPYKDRLALFSRYLQQLVMESLGKEVDRGGNVVHQGIAVYGNKGSTDQHAYVQQLRDGLSNFFVTFIEVLRDRAGDSIEVDDGVTSGDFLQGFLLGTRKALYDNGRPSITLTIPEVNARSVGMLIALYERAVGLYAALVDVNAYHQPGVEAGKKAAAEVLLLKRRLMTALEERGTSGADCEQLAAAIGAEDDVETVFRLLERLCANPGSGVAYESGAGTFQARYRIRRS